MSSGSKSLPRVFCTIRNPFCTGATPFCTGATPFSLPGLKRPFAHSPNHFWEFTGFGLSPRTFVSTAPQHSEICVKFSLFFHTVFDVKFW